MLDLSDSFILSTFELNQTSNFIAGVFNDILTSIFSVCIDFAKS